MFLFCALCTPQSSHACVACACLQVPWTRTPPSVCASPEHRAIALAAARESIVLLNNSAPTSALRLPWPPAPIECVAVIGAYAKVNLSGGKPDYQTTSYSTILEGVSSRFSAAEVSFIPGYGAPDGVGAAAAAEPAAIARAVQSSDVTIVVVGIKGSGNGLYDEHEGHDRTEIGLPPEQLAVVKAAVAVARQGSGGGRGGAGAGAGGGGRSGGDGGTAAAAAAAAAQKRIALVLVNGGPLSCDWCRDHVDTVRRRTLRPTSPSTRRLKRKKTKKGKGDVLLMHCGFCRR